MGSSFTSYHDRGYWSRDETLQYWLSVVAKEIRESRSKHPALLAAAAHWFEQSTLDGSGCVDPDLSRLFADNQDINAALPFLNSAIDKIKLFGAFVPKDELNDNAIGGLRDWWKDDAVRTDSVVRVGRAFIDLLRGELKPPEGGDYYQLNIY